MRRSRRLVLGYAVVAALVALVAWAADRYAPHGFAWLDRQGVTLADPMWLWVACAAIPLWFVTLHGLTDLPVVQRVLSMAVRTALIGLLAFVLAEPQTFEDTEVPVAIGVVVDVSDSMTDQALERAQVALDALWQAAAGSGGNAELYVVATAERAQLLASATDGEPQRAPRLERPAAGAGTDLEAGIRLARSVLPAGAIHRLAVISDGQPTRGSLGSAARLAAADGVPIDALDLSQLPIPAEFWVASLTAPDDIEPRKPFVVHAKLESTTEVEVRCRLFVREPDPDAPADSNGPNEPQEPNEPAQDADVRAEKTLHLVAGATTVEFEELEVARGGEKRFELVCEPTPDSAGSATDRFAANNRRETVAQVPERPKVLYVEGNSREAGDFPRALRPEIEVDVRGPGAIPASVSALAEYDALVVSDMPRQKRRNTLFSTDQMRAVRGYIEQGGVFVFAGGPNSFGPGDYADSYLEKHVLPVDLDQPQNREMPSVALVLVIDKSGSMAGEKIELAKDAAKATATTLQADDLLGVVAFDNKAEEVLPLSRARSRLYILNNLSRLSSGGGTAIRPALERAYSMLRRAEAQTKHVILLTDGQSNRDGVVALAERMLRDRITVSTVAVGDGADATLLQQVAAAAGGNAYRTRDPNQVKRIFVTEAQQLGQNSIVEERFTPRVAGGYGRLQFLRGLGKLPPLLGYVATRAKSGAQVILKTHKGDPLLARKRIGRGWSYAWTSDVKARWARHWVGTATYARFWRQLLLSSMPVEKRAQAFEVAVRVDRGTLTISADAIDEADQFVNGLHAQATLRAPDGTQQQLELNQTASGRYEAQVSLTENTYGTWHVDATFVDPELGESIAEGRAVAIAPYPDELALATRRDTAALQELVNTTGGAFTTEIRAAHLTERSDQTRRTWHHTWDHLLLWALGLFVADVALRRIRLWPGGTRVW